MTDRSGLALRARQAPPPQATSYAQVSLFRTRSRKPERPRTPFAKSLAAHDVPARTPLGLRRKGWEIVVGIDTALPFPLARVIVHVGLAGEVVCGALGGTYPVYGERRSVVVLMPWLARLFAVCPRCAVGVKRGYKQHGAGRPPVAYGTVLTAKFRNGALPEQTTRPTHVRCSRCRGTGQARVTFEGASDELRTCVRCRGTGVYPPRELAS